MRFLTLKETKGVSSNRRMHSKCRRIDKARLGTNKIKKVSYTALEKYQLGKS